MTKKKQQKNNKGRGVQNEHKSFIIINVRNWTINSSIWCVRQWRQWCECGCVSVNVVRKRRPAETRCSGSDWHCSHPPSGNLRQRQTGRRVTVTNLHKHTPPVSGAVTPALVSFNQATFIHSGSMTAIVVGVVFKIQPMMSLWKYTSLRFKL